MVNCRTTGSLDALELTLNAQWQHKVRAVAMHKPELRQEEPLPTLNEPS